MAIPSASVGRALTSVILPFFEERKADGALTDWTPMISASAVAIAAMLGHWLNTLIPITVTSSVVTYFLIRAAKRGNLRVVPNSWLDGFHLKGPA
jgi:hypothetical protein